MTLFIELFSSSAGTLVQSNAKLTEFATGKGYLRPLVHLSRDLVKTLGLKGGKVLIAQTEKATFGNNKTTLFLKPNHSVVSVCVNEDTSKCLNQLEVVHKAEIEELSSHPVHIINKDGDFMHSALIPYCGFGAEMLSLGQHVDNFTYPICTAFLPTLLDGQLCYELDMNRIREPVKRGPFGGLFLVLDLFIYSSVSG